MAKERLQKIIAKAGIASRRKAEAFITDARVRVNGKLVRLDEERRNLPAPEKPGGRPDADPAEADARPENT